MKEALRARINAFLGLHTTLALATETEALGPWIAPVLFAHDENLNCFFLSGNASLHVQALERSARAAISVYADRQEWREITGVQMRVIGSRVPEPDIHVVAGIYAAKFPFVADWLKEQGAAPAELVGPLAGSEFWQLRPTWVRLIDNKLGFGHREEAPWTA